MKRKYSMRDILDFGLYKGYEVGIVFVSDQGYFKWCLDNISGFHLYELETLISIGQVKKTDINWQVRVIGPEANEVIEIFSSIDEILPGGGAYKTEWPYELIEKNRNNLRN